MGRKEIVEKLTNIFRIVFDDQNIVLDENQTPDDIVNWVSLTHMKMVATIEIEFNISFTLKEQIKLMNVGDIINILIEKTK